MIPFNEVPNNLRVPWVYVEFDNQRAVSGPSQQPYKILVIGQRRTAGQVLELVPTRITSAAQAVKAFGAGSMLADMLETVFLNNKITETWAIALNDNGAGVAAAGRFTFTGTSTKAGIVSAYIGGKVISAPVASGSAASVAASALVAAINADLSLPVTAAVNGTDTTRVDVTAKHKGLVGNTLDLRVNYYEGEDLPEGITVAITPMSGGLLNPSVASAIAALGDEQFNCIAMPFSDPTNLNDMENELASRWGPTRQIDGRVFVAANVSHGNLGTLGDSRNSPHLSITAAFGSPTPVWKWAAALAAKVAAEGSLDPARPLQTVELNGILPAKEIDRFTMEERNLLLYDGISTAIVDAGGKVRIERLITTYKTNAMGAADISYLNVETMQTLSYLRYDFRNTFLRKYPRHKLAGDNVRVSGAVMTPMLAKAEAVSIFSSWESLGLVEDAAAFKKALVVERNSQDPDRLDFDMAPNLMNQLRVVGSKIGFIL